MTVGESDWRIVDLIPLVPLTVYYYFLIAFSFIAKTVLTWLGMGARTAYTILSFAISVGGMGISQGWMIEGVESNGMTFLQEYTLYTIFLIFRVIGSHVRIPHRYSS